MNRVTRPSGVCLAVDTDTQMTSAMLTQLSRARYKGRPIQGIGRYVSRGTPAAGDVTAEELDRILAAPFASWPIQHAPRVGWMPSTAMAIEDGTSAAENSLAAQYAAGTHLEIDLEGVSPAASRAQVFDYVEAAAEAIERVSPFVPLLYVGWQSVLTARELWLLPRLHLYGSDPARRSVARRGTAFEQLLLDVVLPKTSTLVDLVDCHADRLGGMLSWTIAA